MFVEEVQILRKQNHRSKGLRNKRDSQGGNFFKKLKKTETPHGHKPSLNDGIGNFNSKRQGRKKPTQNNQNIDSDFLGQERTENSNVWDLKQDNLRKKDTLNNRKKPSRHRNRND
jgi:hypothetical protein